MIMEVEAYKKKMTMEVETKDKNKLNYAALNFYKKRSNYLHNFSGVWMSLGSWNLDHVGFKKIEGERFHP